MITDGLLMLGVLLALSCALIVLERTTGWKLFKYVPGMVLMYLLCAALNSAGVFGQDDATRAPIAAVKDVVLPAMILLFLFGCDLRRIIKLGPRLLLTYAVSAASLFVAMVGVFLAFQSALHPEAWKVLGALLASWTGGSANMVAVQDILQAPENIFGYALITDTLIYSIWLTVAFSSVAISGRFDRFTKARSTHLIDHGDDVLRARVPCRRRTKRRTSPYVPSNRAVNRCSGSGLCGVLTSLSCPAPAPVCQSPTLRLRRPQLL